MAAARKARRLLQLAPLFLGFVALSGCHSPYVTASVRNDTGAAVSPVEVDYPSASFGMPSLAAGATYTYRFKLLGSGESKVVWTDAAQHDHKSAGPVMYEGEEGTLSIVLGPAGATWTPKLRTRQ